MEHGCWTATRRQALAGIGTSAVMTLLPFGAGARATAPEDVSFVVYRDDDEIGGHQVRFARRGERLQVNIEVQFDVTFGFIPLYSYRHRNRELWQGERLIELEARTDDDGTEHWVRAEAEGDRMIVTSSAGRLELPGDTVSTSYWNEAMLAGGAWLDTQSGRLVQSQVEVHPPEQIKARNQVVMAKRYVLNGDIDCELWYHQGHWVKLRFEASDGSIIDYRA